MNIRNFIFAFFVLASGMGQIKADILNDILGRWKISNTTYQNGSKLSSSTGSAQITRIGISGLYWVATVKAYKQPSRTSHTWMFDNGDCFGFIKQGSNIVGHFSGNWRATDNSLTYDIDVTTNSADYTQSVTAIQASKKSFALTSTTSNGLNLVGTATK
jgi:hypothetical protein